MADHPPIQQSRSDENGHHNTCEIGKRSSSSANISSSGEHSDFAYQRADIDRIHQISVSDSSSRSSYTRHKNCNARHDYPNGYHTGGRNHLAFDNRNLAAYFIRKYLIIADADHVFHVLNQ